MILKIWVMWWSGLEILIWLYIGIFKYRNKKSHVLFSISRKCKKKKNMNKKIS